MSTTTVDLKLSQLMEDLANGLSWLKKDDLGFGSIQAKYGANDIQILTIKKHPKLVGKEPSLTLFQVIDDLDKTEEVIEPVSKIVNIVKNDILPTTSSSREPAVTGTSNEVLGSLVPMESNNANLGTSVPQPEGSKEFFEL